MSGVIINKTACSIPDLSRPSRLGVSRELDNYYLSNHLSIENSKFDKCNKKKTKSKVLLDSDDDSFSVDDLIETNGIDECQQNQQSTKCDKDAETRYVKYVSSYVNLNSASSSIREVVMIREVEEVKNINTMVCCDDIDVLVNKDKHISTGSRIKIIATSDGQVFPKLRGLGVNSKSTSICNEICQQHQSRPCICDLDDKTRWSKPISQAAEIVANSNDITLEPNDIAFIGRDNLRYQVEQEKSYRIPPKLCDENLVLGIEPDNNNKSRPHRFNNTKSLGGLGYYKSELQTTRCIEPDQINTFIFKLGKRYINVKSIKLISSVIPFYDTIINNYNNRIYFQIQNVDEILLNLDGSDLWQYDIPIGNYNVSDLGYIIQEDINQLVGKDVINITVNTMRNKFIINSIGDYTFTWEFVVTIDNFRSLYQMLGFSEPKHDTFTDIFANSNNFNLKLDDYIYVSIDGFNQLYDTFTQSYYFNQIKLNNLCDKKQYLDLETILTDAESNFDELIVSFNNQWGQPVDFKKNEFSLVLIVVEYIDRLICQNYNTRRGTTDYTSITRNGFVQKL